LPTGKELRPLRPASLRPSFLSWANRAAREFVTEYVSHVETARLLPSTEDGRRTLLDSLLLEKSRRETDSDLTYRPEWVVIPLRGALRLLG
jgi:maltose alpha-D-glucosyltransferase/alpha-amylase